MARRSIFFLPKFKWFDGVRPTSPDDIFVVPDEMEELMLNAERPAPSATKKSAAQLTTVGETIDDETIAEEDETTDDEAEADDSVNSENQESSESK